ncbi:hypothetical protein PG988_000298 [Apiospora saccharicola]
MPLDIRAIRILRIIFGGAANGQPTACNLLGGSPASTPQNKKNRKRNTSQRILSSPLTRSFLMLSNGLEKCDQTLPIFETMSGAGDSQSLNY